MVGSYCVKTSILKDWNNCYSENYSYLLHPDYVQYYCKLNALSSEFETWYYSCINIEIRPKLGGHSSVYFPFIFKDTLVVIWKF